jgi:hypothetical protein
MHDVDVWFRVPLFIADNVLSADSDEPSWNTNDALQKLTSELVLGAAISLVVEPVLFLGQTIVQFYLATRACIRLSRIRKRRPGDANHLCVEQPGKSFHQSMGPSLSVMPQLADLCHKAVSISQTLVGTRITHTGTEGKLAQQPRRANARPIMTGLTCLGQSISPWHLVSLSFEVLKETSGKYPEK